MTEPEEARQRVLNRNFQNLPLDEVIVTCSEGMFLQGNIQGLKIQHKLVKELRPGDLGDFERMLEERASSTNSTPIPCTSGCPRSRPPGESPRDPGPVPGMRGKYQWQGKHQNHPPGAETGDRETP